MRTVRRFVLSPMNMVDVLAIMPFYVELVYAGTSGGAGLAVMRVLGLLRDVLGHERTCHGRSIR